MIKRLALGIFAWLALSTTVLAGGAADGISVEGAFVRAIPPGLPNSAAFMTLNNSGKADHKLVVVEGTVAKAIELHTHINDNGIMRMRQVEHIAVPAGSKTELKSGGFHVMLIGLTQPLKMGELIDLTLVYEDGSKTQLQAPVQKSAGPAMKCGAGKCGGSGKCGGGGKCGGAKGKCGAGKCGSGK